MEERPYICFTSDLAVLSAELNELPPPTRATARASMRVDNGFTEMPDMLLLALEDRTETFPGESIVASFISLSKVPPSTVIRTGPL